MSQLEKQIGLKIREIADSTHGKRFAIMSGKVVAGSVNTQKLTCKVVLSKDDELATEGVTLNVILESSNGLILYPADNSDVLVCEVDGPTRYALFKCSTLTKMEVKVGVWRFLVDADKVGVYKGNTPFFRAEGNTVTLKSGNKGGIPQAVEVASKINGTSADVNTLKGLFAAFITALGTSVASSTGTLPITDGILQTYFAAFTTWAGANIPPTQPSEIRNDACEHGT